MRLLIDARQDRDVVDRRTEAALPGERRLGPGAPDEIDALGDAVVRFAHVDAERVELVAQETAADAPIEAPLRELVERRSHLGDPHGIVQRQHRRARAEPDAARLGREIREEREIPRAQPAMPHEVMLDHPRVLDADLVGEQHLFDDIVEMRRHVARVGQVGRQIEQSELHGAQRR